MFDEKKHRSLAKLCGLNSGDTYFVSGQASNHRQIYISSVKGASSSSRSIMENWREILYSIKADLIVAVIRQ